MSQRHADHECGSSRGRPSPDWSRAPCAISDQRVEGTSSLRCFQATRIAGADPCIKFSWWKAELLHPHWEFGTSEDSRRWKPLVVRSSAVADRRFLASAGPVGPLHITGRMRCRRYPVAANDEHLLDHAPSFEPGRNFSRTLRDRGMDIKSARALAVKPSQPRRVRSPYAERNAASNHSRRFTTVLLSLVRALATNECRALATTTTTSPRSKQRDGGTNRD